MTCENNFFQHSDSIPPKKAWARLGLMVMLVLVSDWVGAQVTGVHWEVDRVFYQEDADLEPTFQPLVGMVSYIIYADVTYENDWIGEVYALEAQPGGDPADVTNPMYFSSTEECWNDPASGPSIGISDQHSLFGMGIYPSLEYDSFVGLGALNVDEDEASPVGVYINTQQGSGFCGTQVFDGAFARTQTVDDATGLVTGPVVQFGGADLSVPIARITTAGDVCFSMNLAYRPQAMTNPYDANTDEYDAWIQENRFQMQEALCFDNVCGRYASDMPAISGTSLLCPGNSSTVEVEFLGGENITEADLTYALFNITSLEETNGTGALVFEDLYEGDYILYTEDTNGCKDTVEFAVVAPPQIEANIHLVDDNSCFGEADARIEIPDSMLVGGTGALQISVQGPNNQSVAGQPFEFGTMWDGLVCQDGDGDFIFTITDNNGCTLKDTVPVNCPEEISVALSYGDVICAGDADGFIVAEVSGGTGELYLTNQNETVLASDGLLDLGPGTYLVSVFDDNDCASEQELVIIEEPAPLEMSIGDITNPSCGLDCDGEVALTAQGGMGPLEVSYFNTSTGGFSLDSIGLCAGEYVATVTDTSGCQLTGLFEIEAPAPLDFLIAATNATCTGMSNGSADVFPIGGTVSDQEYDWAVLDTAGNVANLNNLSEMIYTAVVTDQIGCTYAETFAIGIDFVTDMELNTLTSPVTCWNAADGTATVSVNGGEAPFTYSWSDPYAQTTSTAVGLTEDTYTVVVTDAVGCRRTASQELDAIEGCLFIADALTPNDDGKNDDWVVGGLEDYPLSKVLVFNRWGQKVFETDGGQERWDGRFNGARLPIADYYYTIELFPEALPIRGTVTLKY